MAGGKILEVTGPWVVQGLVAFTLKRNENTPEGFE